MVTASWDCETNSRGDCETNSRGNFCTTGCWKVAMFVKYVQNGCQNFGYNFTLEICHTLWALGGNALKSVNLQWFFSTSIFLGWIFSLYIILIPSWTVLQQPQGLRSLAEQFCSQPKNVTCVDIIGRHSVTLTHSFVVVQINVGQINSWWSRGVSFLPIFYQWSYKGRDGQSCSRL